MTVNCVGVLDKALSATLLAGITYQTYYNFRGAVDLGGKYIGLDSLTYSVFSLLPALAISLAHARLSFARTQETMDKVLSKVKIYKVLSLIYFAIFLYLLCFKVFA